MSRTIVVLAVCGSLVLGGSAAAPAQSVRPTPAQVVSQACDAAGGLEAFRGLGLLRLTVQDDAPMLATRDALPKAVISFLSPGPTPGRIFFPGSGALLAHDRSLWWWMTRGAVDTSPGVSADAQRTLRDYLFTLLLPFSLTWEGVSLDRVEALTNEGRLLWRLWFEVPTGFFRSEAISHSWWVDFDRGSFAFVSAGYPAVDASGREGVEGRQFTPGGFAELRAGDAPAAAVLLPSKTTETAVAVAGDHTGSSTVETIWFESLPSAYAQPLFAVPAGAGGLAEQASIAGVEEPLLLRRLRSAEQARSSAPPHDGPTLSDLASGRSVNQGPGEKLVIIGQPPTPEQVAELRQQLDDESFAPGSRPAREFELRVAEIAARAAPLMGMVNRYEQACRGKYTVTAGQGVETGARAGGAAGVEVSTEGRAVAVGGGAMTWAEVWARAAAWSTSTANESTLACRGLAADIQTLTAQVRTELNAVVQALPAGVSRYRAEETLAKYGLSRF